MSGSRHGQQSTEWWSLVDCEWWQEGSILVIWQTMGMAPPSNHLLGESENWDRARRKFSKLSTKISSRNKKPGSLQSSQPMPTNAKKTHRELNALFFVGSQLAASTSWMACGHCEVARKTEMVRRSGGQMDKLLLLKKKLHHLTFFDTADVSFPFCLCIN